MSVMDEYTINASGCDRKFIEHMERELANPANGRSPNKKLTTKIKKELYVAGWKPGWIHEQLGNLSDDILQGKSLSESIEAIIVIWIAKTQVSGRLFQDFTSMGLTGKVARKAAHAYNPLKNTCYTDEQLLLDSIKFLVG
jgi:hypothetical protein